MIYLKTKVVGVDIPIQALQNYLYVQLKKKWSLSDANLQGYGRIYRNQTPDGYSPEAYLGNGEYGDTFFDDKTSVNFAFFLGDVQKYSAGGMMANVSVSFCLNVPLVKPGYAWRADEEIRLDVENILHSPRMGFIYQGTETGIDNVFREYSGWNKKKGIQYMDMHPLHCFRINLSTVYSVSIC
jgi:hypothetical protein